MSKHQPLVWSEGLLLAPQHLQQWDRAVQYLLAERFRLAHSFEWGLTQLEIDRETLRNGRVSVMSARGVLPDGTPFAAPEEDPLPPPRALEGHFDARQESLVVSLGLPSARPGRPQFGPTGVPGQPTPRYTPETLELPDANTGGDERAVAVARRNLTLLFPDDALGDHDHVSIAEVVRTSDGGFALREDFVPPCLSIGASEWLVRQLRTELEMLIAKSSELGEKRRHRGGVADFSTADTTSFLQLLTVNGAIPLLAHFIAHRRAHPEGVYLALASLAGELCTFSGDRHPKDLPGYEHRALGATFQGVHSVLSQLLLVTHATKATRIELEKREGGIWLGQIADSRLLEAGSQLFLGVKADIEEQRLQVEIPIKLKISSLDRIDFLIANALRGVPAGFVRVPPAALPVKTSFLYFQLDANHELWEGIKGAKNVAIFMPPEYPGLALELIGVRE